MMNLLNDANRQQDAFSYMLKEMSGYETITTFFMDFSIADVFGEEGIRDTYNRSIKHWKHDYKFITELYLVLNHKIWQWYKKNNDLAKLYDELWRDCGSYCDDNFSKDELEYFYKITD